MDFKNEASVSINFTITVHLSIHWGLCAL